MITLASRQAVTGLLCLCKDALQYNLQTHRNRYNHPHKQGSRKQDEVIQECKLCNRKPCKESEQLVGSCAPLSWFDAKVGTANLETHDKLRRGFSLTRVLRFVDL